MFVVVAIGMAGSALQSVARNPLASPDVLGVTTGASFPSPPIYPSRLTVSLPASLILLMVHGYH